MPSLAILDVSENPLACDKDFKALITWVVKQSIAHGPAEKTHAALKALKPMVNDKFLDPKGVQRSWQSLAYTVCTFDDKDSMASSSSSSGTLNKDVDTDDVDNIDSDIDDEYDNYMDEVSDEITKQDKDMEQDDEDDEDEDAAEDDKDDDAEGVIIDGGLTVTEGESKKGKGHRNHHQHPIIDEDSFEEVFEDLEREVRVKGELQRGYWTLAIIMCCFTVAVLIIVRIAMMMMNKRHERYRQAILASKNSFVYQKLSEDIGGSNGKLPATPKVHRYQPIEQV